MSNRGFLRVEALVKSFAGIRALNGISFSVEKGGILGLIGPNGSGKSVTIDCITGYLTPDAGAVFLGGEEITGLKPHEAAVKGMARTFQLARLYPMMTVYQLLSFAKQSKSIKENLGRFTQNLAGRKRERFAEDINKVLSMTGLAPFANEKISNLSYGHQKILGFAALTLMRPEPTVFLLDEPMAGLDASEATSFMELIRSIRSLLKTFVIVEHNLKIIMGLCDRVVVLNEGEKIFEGTPQETMSSQKVVEAYLGSCSRY